MPSRPSIREIAKIAGVSRASAQRALANNPRCAKSTREKVLEVARRLGYRPDPLFAAMGSRRKRAANDGIPIAFIEACEPESRPGPRYENYCAQRAEELGYHLQVINLNAWESPERLWQILFARGFGGVVIGRVDPNWHNLLLKNEIFPVVSCGHANPLPFHAVRPSITSVVLAAWRVCLERGYRRIGAAIFRHTPAVEDDLLRHGAVCALQCEYHPESEWIPPLTSVHYENAAFSKWAKEHKPEAVIGFSVGDYFRLCDLGFKIPEETGFVSLHMGDDTPRGKFAGFNQHAPEVGRAAMNLLDQMIRHGELGVPHRPRTETIVAEWIDGESLPVKSRKV